MTGKNVAVKAAVYTVLLLLLYLVNRIFFPSLRIFSATPDIIPYIVAFVAVLEGFESGTLFGLGAGLLTDSMSAGYGVFFTLSLFLLGALTGLLADLYFRRNLGYAMICGAVIYLTVYAGRFFLFFYLYSKAGIGDFITAFFPGFIYSSILAVPLFLAVHPLSRLLNKYKGSQYYI